ncbi:hypothetical protein ACFC1T_09170 [Kitasatospora sp. NPDC056076]|uniref:hypothetical protein n=1 Tax=Kitasatospora sp. NPDC056076 TaxID=3345703 RepID=UPI0035E0666A
MVSTEIAHGMLAKYLGIPVHALHEVTVADDPSAPSPQFVQAGIVFEHARDGAGTGEFGIVTANGVVLVPGLESREQAETVLRVWPRGPESRKTVHGPADCWVCCENAIYLAENDLSVFTENPGRSTFTAHQLEKWPASQAAGMDQLAHYNRALAESLAGERAALARSHDEVAGILEQRD